MASSGTEAQARVTRGGSRAPIAAVVQQHVDDAAALHNTRTVLVTAPHVGLHHLRRFDDRLEAHLDGIAVAGDFGWEMCVEALASPGPGTAFIATVRAIDKSGGSSLHRLLAAAEAQAAFRHGLSCAFGWVPAHSLRGITKGLLGSPNAFQRQIGLAACAMHRVDPGAALEEALAGSEELGLHACALRMPGTLGLVELLRACLNVLGHEDPACNFQAARSALLLGDHDASVAELQRIASVPSPYLSPALGLLLKVVAPAQAHRLLTVLNQDPTLIRALIRATGTKGDPYYVPWLIKQMNDPKLTRLAGESFSFITGVDLAYLDLDRKPPESIEFGPNDDPNDNDVAMDEDDGLPWPDPPKIAAWWNTNGSRFVAGTRYFIGEPPTRTHCLNVLKTGFQRQRIAAAEYLCLLQPGTPLFNTTAPAWRQQRLLAQMGA